MGMDGIGGLQSERPVPDQQEAQARMRQMHGAALDAGFPMDQANKGSSAIARLQAFIGENGGTAVRADGIFGERTARALSALLANADDGQLAALRAAIGPQGVESLQSLADVVGPEVSRLAAAAAPAETGVTLGLDPSRYSGTLLRQAAFDVTGGLRLGPEAAMDLSRAFVRPQSSRDGLQFRPLGASPLAGNGPTTATGLNRVVPPGDSPPSEAPRPLEPVTLRQTLLAHVADGLPMGLEQSGIPLDMAGSARLAEFVAQLEAGGPQERTAMEGVRDVTIDALQRMDDPGERANAAGRVYAAMMRATRNFPDRTAEHGAGQELRDLLSAVLRTHQEARAEAPLREGEQEHIVPFQVGTSAVVIRLHEAIRPAAQ